MIKYWAHRFDVHYEAFGIQWRGLYKSEDVADLAKRCLYNLTDNSLRFTVADQTDKLIAELEQIVRENEQTKTDSKK